MNMNNDESPIPSPGRRRGSLWPFALFLPPAALVIWSSIKQLPDIGEALLMLVAGCLWLLFLAWIAMGFADFFGPRKR